MNCVAISPLIALMLHSSGKMSEKRRGVLDRRIYPDFPAIGRLILTVACNLSEDARDSRLFRTDASRNKALYFQRRSKHKLMNVIFPDKLGAIYPEKL